VINMPLLIASLAAIVILLPVASFTRSYQLKRTAEAFSERAAQLEEDRDWRTAAEYLDRYRRLRPDDDAAIIKLARTYDQAVAASSGNLDRAVQLYFQAIGTASASSQANVTAELPELRCRLAELSLQLGRSDPSAWSRAADVACQLPARDSESDLDERGWRVLALARLGKAAQNTVPEASSSGDELEGTIGQEAKKFSLVELLETALAMQPDDGALAFSLILDVYQQPDQWSKHFGDDVHVDEQDLADRACRVIDQFVDARRRNLAAFLRDLGASALQERLSSESGDSNASMTADAALATAVNEMEHTLASGPQGLSQNARLSFGELLVDGLRAGNLPKLAIELTDAMPKEIGLALAVDGPATVDSSVRDALVDWCLEQRPKVLDLIVTTPLKQLNVNYVEALVARAEYRLQHEIAGGEVDLEIARQHAPNDVRALMLSGRSAVELMDEAEQQGDSDMMLKHAKVAEEMYQRAIDIQPNNQMAYLSLGELYLNAPDVNPNDGSGRVRITGRVTSVPPGGSVRCHLEGADNDIVIGGTAQLAHNAEVIFVNQSVEGDEAKARFAKDDNRLIVDIDPKKTRAATIVESINATDGFVASLDSAIDRAVATWQGGLRASRDDSLLISARLAEVLISAGHSDAAEDALLALDRSAKELAVGGNRQQMDLVARRREILRARRMISTGDPNEGVKLLESILPEASAVGDNEIVIDVWKLLADTNRDIGRFDEAARALEELATLESEYSSRHRAKAASLWAIAGNLPRAVSQFERSLDEEDSPETWLALANTRLEHQRRLEVADRDWVPFNDALAALKDPQRRANIVDPWRIGLLEANYVLVKSDVDTKSDAYKSRFAKSLAKLEARYPDSPQLLRQLVNLYEELGQHGDADRSLARLSELAPAGSQQTVDVVLLRSNVARERNDIEAARSALESGLANLPRQFHSTLQNSLVKIDLMNNDVRAAKTRLLAANEEDPLDANVVLRLADIALSTKEDVEITRWQKELERIEGTEGPNSRVLRARRLLSLSDEPSDERQEEAKQILESLSTELPTWVAPKWLLGQIAESRGEFADAARHYQQMLDVGAGFIDLYERSVNCLCRAGDFRQASVVLVQARSNGLESQRLETLGYYAAAGTGDVAEALAKLKERVRKEPDNGDAWLLLARLLIGARDSALQPQIESALKKAATLQPNDLAVHAELLRYLASISKLDNCRKVVDQIAKFEGVDFADQQIVLAEGHSLLGENQQAEACLTQAVEVRPDDPTLRIRYCRLVGNRDAAEGEALLRDLLSDFPDFEPAQQALALVLSDKRNSNAWVEALGVLENGEEEIASVNNLRLKARLLARRGGDERRREARELIELVRTINGELEDSDRVLLAQLYEAEGRSRDAEREMLALVNHADATPEQLVAHIHLLIRRQELGQAEQWLDRLEEVAPNSAKAIELRALWLHQLRRDQEVVALVERFVKDHISDDTPPQKVILVYEWIGKMYSNFKMYEQSERSYRRLYELQPSAYKGLAVALAYQSRVDESLEVCINAWNETHHSEAAVAMSAVLQTGSGSREHYELAEPYFQEALERFPDNINLHIMIANMRLVRGQKDDAVRLYRTILEHDPRNLLAMNNLAALLSETSSTRTEAIQIVDTAIRIAGEMEVAPAIEALLFDTKGSALLYQGLASESIDHFEHAVRLNSNEAIYQLHLAAAQQRAGLSDIASSTFELADQLGVRTLNLNRLDRKLLDELDKVSARAAR
jgi:tetratricopeptide (TPR) repeat protein